MGSRPELWRGGDGEGKLSRWREMVGRVHPVVALRQKQTFSWHVARLSGRRRYTFGHLFQRSLRPMR